MSNATLLNDNTTEERKDALDELVVKIMDSMRTRWTEWKFEGDRATHTSGVSFDGTKILAPFEAELSVLASGRLSAVADVAKAKQAGEMLAKG